MKCLIAIIVTISFIFSNFQPVWAQSAEGFNVNQLPVPGTMVAPSQNFVPVLLKGLVIHPNQPFNFDFIVDSGNDSPDKANIQEQSQRMIRYFLTALTIPSGDLWVNLSPYEKDRIITNELGQTDMGRDMLAQDYVLKQLTASLIYPEKDLGKEFWSRVYKKVGEKTGSTNIPVNTFNKVWIVPNGADVFEHGNAVYVTQARLKVMLEEDYLSLQEHNGISAVNKPQIDTTHAIGNQVVRDIILPEIEKEVNKGQNFALLRQVYYAAILAKWYRAEIQKTILAQVYVDKKKIAGIDLDDNSIKDQIYQRYIRAYKKGVFNFIKEDSDNMTGQIVPRKYFSGGEILNQAMIHVAKVGPEDVQEVGRDFDAHFSVIPKGLDAAMNGQRETPMGMAKRFRQALSGALIGAAVFGAPITAGASDKVSGGVAQTYHLNAKLLDKMYGYFMNFSIDPSKIMWDENGVKEELKAISTSKNYRQQAPTFGVYIQHFYDNYPTLRYKIGSLIVSQAQDLWDSNRTKLVGSVNDSYKGQTSLTEVVFGLIVGKVLTKEDVTSIMAHMPKNTPDYRFLKEQVAPDIDGQSIVPQEVQLDTKLLDKMYGYFADFSKAGWDEDGAKEELKAISTSENYKQQAPIFGVYIQHFYDNYPVLQYKIRDLIVSQAQNLWDKNRTKLVGSDNDSYKGQTSLTEVIFGLFVGKVLTKDNVNSILGHMSQDTPDYEFLKEQIDRAQVVDFKDLKGGIDLNQINVNHAGQGVNLLFDAAQISEITRPDFNGFRIIVNSVIQIQSPLSLMGVQVGVQ